MSSNLNISQVQKLLNSNWSSLEQATRVQVERPGGIPSVVGLEGPPSQGVGSFVDHLKNAINDVNQFQVEADKASQALASGKTQNIHETMMKMEQADVAMRTLMAVRGKVIEAYKEIMRMQV